MKEWFWFSSFLGLAVVISGCQGQAQAETRILTLATPAPTACTAPEGSREYTVDVVIEGTDYSLYQQARLDPKQPTVVLGNVITSQDDPQHYVEVGTGIDPQSLPRQFQSLHFSVCRDEEGNHLYVAK